MSSQILDGLQQDCWLFSEQGDSGVASHTQQPTDCVCLVVVVKSERVPISLINPTADCARILLFASKNFPHLFVIAKQLPMNTAAITTLATISIC